SFAGRYYAASEARMHPGCVQQPRIPFAIAATGPRGMRLVARHGACWVTTGDRSGATAIAAAAGAAIVRAQAARLDAACAEAGRDPRSLARRVLSGAELDAGLASRDSFADTLGRYADCGVTDFVVHWPRASAPYAGELAHFERVIGSARRPD